MHPLTYPLVGLDGFNREAGYNPEQADTKRQTTIQAHMETPHRSQAADMFELELAIRGQCQPLHHRPGT